VRGLFGLPDKEDIYDDFSCKEGLSVSGRMYLTTNYMCFFSSLLGITKKMVNEWADITKLEKQGSTSIKVFKFVTTKKGEKKEETNTFSGFSDRDTSYKYIVRLWSNSSPYAKDTDSEDDDKESETGDNSTGVTVLEKDVSELADGAHDQYSHSFLNEAATTENKPNLDGSGGSAGKVAVEPQIVIATNN